MAGSVQGLALVMNGECDICVQGESKVDEDVSEAMDDWNRVGGKKVHVKRKMEMEAQCD